MADELGIMVATDIHQHLWPEGFVAALAARNDAPSVRRDGRGWLIRVPGEPDSPFGTVAHDPAVAAHGHPDGTQHIARATLRRVRVDLLAPPDACVDDLAANAQDATVLALGHANASPHVARPALLRRLMLGPGLRGGGERKTGREQQRHTPGAKPGSWQVERPEELPHAVISVLAYELAAYAPPRPIFVHE